MRSAGLLLTLVARSDPPPTRSANPVRRHRVLRSLLLVVVLGALTLGVVSRADAYVYWANRGGEGGGTTLGRASLDGGGATQAFIGNAAGPCGVAVDDAHVYWSNIGGSTIGRANLDGSGVDRSFITGADFPCGVAVNQTHVFWANFDGTIGRANLDGSGADQSFISGADLPCGVAVSDTHVFWGNQGLSTIGTTIGRANLNGAPASVDQSFITGADGPCGLVANATHLFWANSGGGGGSTIGRATLNGNPASADQSFIAGANAPCGVAVSATRIYWANSGGETIGRASLDGGGADQDFIAGANVPCGVAVDALPLPSNEFSFGKLKKNKRRGTAKLTVKVPGPGELDLARTKRVKPDEAEADAAEDVRLRIKPRRRAKRLLDQRGSAKARADVTFTPDGGEANTESRSLRLKRR